MVAPNRELANTHNFSFSQPSISTITTSNQQQESSGMDVKENNLRGHSVTSYNNGQRHMSVESNAFFLEYAERIQMSDVL